MVSKAYRPHGDFFFDASRVVVRCQFRKLDEKRDPIWCDEKVVVQYPEDGGKKEGLCPKCKFPLMVTFSRERGLEAFTAIS